MSIQIRWLASWGMRRWRKMDAPILARPDPPPCDPVRFHRRLRRSRCPRRSRVRLWLAAPADRVRRRASRRGAAGVRRRASASPPTARRPTTRSPSSGWRCSIPLADALLLLAMTLGGGLAAIIAWTETLPIGPLWRDVADVRGRRRRLRHRQPAVLVVAHVPHRGALRLQPDDARSCGSPTSPRARRRRRARPAAAGPRPVADARRRIAVVAVGMGRVDGASSS